ncbi:MAG: squalene/phytoene synthase family protein [Candidatus Zixiibacteriota bacterium]|nr:MAG: squalene/phytoene synthase family protein [candidate division Zixibacteria bacterium]
MPKLTRDILDIADNLDVGSIQANPILDIAARFWEQDRYAAFRVCYLTMRWIDDLVDDVRKETGSVPAAAANRLRSTLIDWLGSVKRGEKDGYFHHRILEVIRYYAIPIWPWERLCKAMVYDLNHNGFSSFRRFLIYAEGAAVAPAAVFLHLCGVEVRGDICGPPSFDIRNAARALARFCYLVHILRDFQKDHLENLNYFADNHLAEYSLTPADLRLIAEGGQIPQAFRNLIRRYVDYAGYYRGLARKTIDGISPHLQHRYQLSLEIIYGMYLQVFERIDPEKGGFSREQLTPSAPQVHERVMRIVLDFAGNR